MFCKQNIFLFQIIPSLLEQAINEHDLISASSVVGMPHPDPDKGQMAAACVKLKNPRVKNTQDEIKIKRDIIEYLFRKVRPENMPLGGIHIMETFPQTTCGKVDKIELVNILSNKKH